MNRALLEKLIQKTDRELPIPLAKSTFPNALVIDLSSQSAQAVEVSQNYLNKYVGGPALAARLWTCFAGEDEEDSPLVITGGISGSIVTVGFRSPVTKTLTFNTFSGKFTLNYCAVVVIGKLDKLGVAVYSDNLFHVDFNRSYGNISALKINEFYPGSIATGIAADNGVAYACAVCNNCVTGRGGLGLVMAGKNLKAIDVGILPTVRDTFDFSTFVRNASILGWAPVDNISKRTDPRLFHLCTSEKTRKLGDVYIPCQAILMLGSNVGCYDIASVYERYRFCLEKGLDPVSVGNVLGWMKEAQERGVISFSDPVDFKNNDHVLLLMEAIVTGQSYADVFARGTAAAAEFYGNKKFSKEINGLECGPYDYRGTVASAINDAVGNWFPVYFDLIPGLKIKDKVALTVYNEELVMGIQCMNINPDVVVPLMADKIGKFKRLLISKNIVSFDRLINPDDLNLTDVFTVGQNCRTLVRTINRVLSNNRYYVPDYFCIDPESNASDETIVDIRHLINRYKNNLQMTRK